MGTTTGTEASVTAATVKLISGDYSTTVTTTYKQIRLSSNKDASGVPIVSSVIVHVEDATLVHPYESAPVDNGSRGTIQGQVKVYEKLTGQNAVLIFTKDKDDSGDDIEMNTGI